MIHILKAHLNTNAIIIGKEGTDLIKIIIINQNIIIILRKMINKTNNMIKDIKTIILIKA